MTLIQSTSEQLINDFCTFILPNGDKHIAAKNAIIHLNKLIQFCNVNKIKNELLQQQLDYIKENYKL
jgi:hypothetical protein